MILDELIESVWNAFKKFVSLSSGQLMILFGVDTKIMGAVLSQLVKDGKIVLDELNPSVWILK